MKKLLSIVAAILFAATTFAQVDEVTLTTIGTGVNEEQATLQALRSAIEQSFGTFVSANTTILNDKLVQDEIVSVSRGNVKEYKKLAVSTLPNGQVSVSVKATVSINKLISYAKSKGSKAEFAGQTFSSNLKLMQLRAQSTKKAMDLLMQQLDQIAKDMFDFNLVLGEPVKEGNTFYFSPEIEVWSNEASTNFYTLLTSTLGSLSLSSKNDYEFCKNAGIPVSTMNFMGEDDSFRGGFSYTLLLDDKVCENYRKQIYNIMDNAYFRFVIAEIGRSDNRYVCASPYINKNWKWESTNLNELRHGKYKKMARNRSIRETNWGVGSPRKKIIISSISYDNTAGSMKGDLHKLSRTLCLSEIKTPLKLTKEQKTALKKGTYFGPTETVTYENPTLLTKLITSIPADGLAEGRFQGFELVGSSASKTDTRMCDLGLMQPAKIRKIRILTKNLPKKTYTISMTGKGSNGAQTYEIKISANKQECKYWEFSGGVFSSTLPNTIIGEEKNGYIEFSLICGNYTIKKFPSELNDFVFVKR